MRKVVFTNSLLKCHACGEILKNPTQAEAKASSWLEWLANPSAQVISPYQTLVRELGFLHVSYLLVKDRATFCFIHLDKRFFISDEYLSKIDQIISRELTNLLVDYFI